MIAIHESLPTSLQGLINLADYLVETGKVKNYYFALRSLRMLYLIRRVDPGCDVVNWNVFYKSCSAARTKFRRMKKQKDSSPLVYLGMGTELNDLRSIQRLNGV